MLTAQLLQDTIGMNNSAELIYCNKGLFGVYPSLYVKLAWSCIDTHFFFCFEKSKTLIKGNVWVICILI